MYIGSDEAQLDCKLLSSLWTQWLAFVFVFVAQGLTRRSSTASFSKRPAEGMEEYLKRENSTLWLVVDKGYTRSTVRTCERKTFADGKSYHSSKICTCVYARMHARIAHHDHTDTHRRTKTHTSTGKHLDKFTDMHTHAHEGNH